MKRLFSSSNKQKLKILEDHRDRPEEDAPGIPINENVLSNEPRSVDSYRTLVITNSPSKKITSSPFGDKGKSGGLFFPMKPYQKHDIVITRELPKNDNGGDNSRFPSHTKKPFNFFGRLPPKSPEILDSFKKRVKRISNTGQRRISSKTGKKFFEKTKQLRENFGTRIRNAFIPQFKSVDDKDFNELNDFGFVPLEDITNADVDRGQDNQSSKKKGVFFTPEKHTIRRRISETGRKFLEKTRGLGQSIGRRISNQFTNKKLDPSRPYDDDDDGAPPLPPKTREVTEWFNSTLQSTGGGRGQDNDNSKSQDPRDPHQQTGDDTTLEYNYIVEDPMEIDPMEVNTNQDNGDNDNRKRGHDDSDEHRPSKKRQYVKLPSAESLDSLSKDVILLILNNIDLNSLKKVSETNKRMAESAKAIMKQKFWIDVDYVEPGWQRVYGVTDTDELRNLPSSVTHITFANDFNQLVNGLPPKVTHLKFGNKFNQPVDNLPQTITHLTFGWDFNQPVDKLPQTVTHLTFRGEFNQPVDNLPDGLKHLTFGNWFGKSVNNLPNTLKHLTFGYGFNEPVNNLPQSVTHLTFGYAFNQPVDNLPQSVTHLTFGHNFSKPVDNLPQSVTHLKFGKSFYHPVNNLPQSITHLTFGDEFNLPVNSLPSNLTHLTFGNYFNQPVDNLPQSVTHLSFGNAFNQPVDNLPSNLRYLTFGYAFNRPVNNLPQSLTHVKFGYKFKQPVDNLPDGLKHLTLAIDYRIPINKFPESIIHKTAR